MRWVLILVLLVGPAAALPGPGVTVLVYHQYPDPADPLGVPFRDGVDAFTDRYASLPPSGFFDFPYLVADGRLPVASIPNATAPFASTLSAYQAVFAERLQSEAPLGLTLATTVHDASVAVTLDVRPRSPLGSGLHAWLSLVQDHLEYTPPPALSNGVTDHRFTVRDSADLGALNLANGSASHLQHAFLLAPGADLSQMYVAAWVQNGAAGRFQPQEVVQATMHALTDPEPTVQDEKGVLIELLSAVWCKPCLFGDLAVARLAQEHGLPQLQAASAPNLSYWRPPQAPWQAGAAALGAALVGWWATRRRP
ncbi:MAG: hypothetical protein ACYDBQ_02720 [Thermoplasmatota archaeon]